MLPYVVQTKQDLADVRDYFLKQDAFAFDVETWGPWRGSPKRNDVLWLALATHDKTAVIPMGHPNGDLLVSKATKKLDKETRKFTQIPAVYDVPPAQLKPGRVFETLEPLFFSESITKIAHNAPFDLLSVNKYYGGETPFPPYRDTIVQRWLLNENRRLGLKVAVEETFGHKYDTEEVGKCVEIHPFWKVAQYQFWDVRYTWMLDQQMMPQIKREGLSRVFRLEMDVLDVFCSMINHGAPIDEDSLRDLDWDLARRVVEIEKKIYQSSPGGFDDKGVYTPSKFGGKFNLNSPQQKAKILWGEKADGFLGLKPKEWTPGGKKRALEALHSDKRYRAEPTDYSTDEKSLEEHQNIPLVAHLLEYQETNKLLTTYVRAYRGHPGDESQDIKPVAPLLFNGRLHPDFVQYGTVSGRVSCRSPNLQNIPRPDTDLGKKIRGLFIPTPDNLLVVADYGQVELVILAHYAGPGRLWDGFFAGLDPHTATAAALFNTSPDFVTKEERRVAKNCNFAVIYGASAKKVAAMSNISVTDAKAFLALHRKLFPEIYIFIEMVLSRCRQTGYIRTISGRYRRLPDINSSVQAFRGRAERQAINSLIQGTQADIAKVAMVRLHRTLPEDMHLILTVHDELVTIVPKDKVEEGSAIVREAMVGEGINNLLETPLRVDIKAVERWSDAK